MCVISEDKLASFLLQESIVSLLIYCLWLLSWPPLLHTELGLPAMFLPKALMHQLDQYTGKAQVTRGSRYVRDIDTWLSTSLIQQVTHPLHLPLEKLGRQLESWD